MSIPCSHPPKTVPLFVSHIRMNDITCLLKAKILFLPLTPFSLSQQPTINHQVPSVLTLQISWLCHFFSTPIKMTLTHSIIISYLDTPTAFELVVYCQSYPHPSSMISFLHYSWGFFYKIQIWSCYFCLKNFNDSSMACRIKSRPTKWFTRPFIATSPASYLVTLSQTLHLALQNYL